MCGTYVQRCKHSAHRECFERYRAADSFRSVGAIDRETLQCICPVCLRLSNVLIPPPLPTVTTATTTTTTTYSADSDNDDLSFFIPLCYAENREATIHPDQELFYVVCRSLAYTAASYELAARSTGPLAAYLTPERRGILAALLTKARSALPLLEDPNTNIPALVAALVNPSAPAEATATLGGRTLFSLDTFTVFVAYMATITAKNPSRADRSFILSLLVAEMCKVRAAASPAGGAEEVTMGQVTAYCVPFLRRVMALLVAAEEHVLPTKEEEDEDVNEYDFYTLVALLKLPRIPLVSRSFADATVAKVLESCGSQFAGELFAFLEGSEKKLGGTSSTSVTEADRFRLVFAQARPFKVSVFAPKIEQMFVDYSKKVCPTCGTRPKYPALCLVCGKFLCSLTSCCDHECNKHIKECMKTHGAFFGINNNYIIFIRSDHKYGTLFGSPYADR